MTRTRFAVSTLVMLAMLGVLLRLGFWQMERLEWKTALLAELAAKAAQDPWAHAFSSETFSDTKNEFTRGFVTGRYSGSPSFAIGPRSQNGVLGYWLVSPLQMKAGGTVLINRGFVPDTLKDKALTSPVPKGTVQVAGVVRLPDDKGANNAHIQVWRHIDTEGMAPGALPLVLYASGSKPSDLSMLEAVPAVQSIRNDHRQYAMFWFAMAAVLVVMWGLFSFQGRR